jgi:hypothetical protein
MRPTADRPRALGRAGAVRPELIAGIKFFGRYRSSAIRDGVLLSVR